jgi:AcrR family transcriptional regulator
MARPATPPDAADRARVLAAAGELMAEVGPARVRLTDIAARSGLAYGSLYRHFASREELLLEAMLEQARDVEQRWSAAADGAGTPVERIIALCIAPLRVASEHPRSREMFATSLFGATDGPIDVVAHFRRMAADVQGQLEKLIAEAQKAGAFALQDPRTLAISLFGIPTAFLSDVFVPDEPDWATVIAEVTLTITRLAGARSAEP